MRKVNNQITEEIKMYYSICSSYVQSSLSSQRLLIEFQALARVFMDLLKFAI